MITFQLRVAVPGRPAYDVSHRQLVPIFALASLPVGGVVPVMVDPRDPTRLTMDLAGEAIALRQAAQAAPQAMPPGQVVPNTLSTMRAATPNAFTADLAPAVPGLSVPGWGTPSGVSLDPGMLAQGSVVVGAPMTLDASPTGQAANATLLANGRPGTAFVREARDTGIDVHGDSVVELTLDVTPQGGTAYEVRTATLVPAVAGARALPGATVPVRIDPAQPASVAIDWLA
jgi:hypothetical protein